MPAHHYLGVLVAAVVLVVYGTYKTFYDLWNLLFAFKIVRGRFSPPRILFSLGEFASPRITSAFTSLQRPSSPGL